MILDELAKLSMVLAEPKNRMLATREGVPFCGFRFLPGLRPRVLGATKRRFEARWRGGWRKRRNLRLGLHAGGRGARLPTKAIREGWRGGTAKRVIGVIQGSLAHFL